MLEQEQQAASSRATLSPHGACFEQWFEESPNGMALVDPAGRPVRCNPALERFLGYSTVELQKLSFCDFTHPEDVDLDWDLYGQLVSGKRRQYQIDKRYLHKSGVVVWGRLTVLHVPGEPCQILGMVEDLSATRVEAAKQAHVVRELRERVKELNVLHDLARLTRQRSLGTLAVLGGVVARVPAAFQYPERTAARIKMGAVCGASETFIESPCRLVATTELSNGTTLELCVVCWGKTDDPCQEFLPEEQAFLDSAVELIAGALDRRLRAGHLPG